MSETPPPLVSVERLTVAFGPGRRRLLAVDSLSLTIHPGKSFGIVGESGSGKSTLARAIVGLAPITAGDILLHGRSLMQASASEAARLRRGVQLVFQDPTDSLNPRLTVERIVGEGLSAMKPPPADIRDRVAETLRLVGLSPDDMTRYPHEFSGGQRQRIGIARALAPGPELLICDEPVSALDVSVRAQILNLLAELREQRRLTILLIAHDLAVVRRFCDEVAVMHHGRLIEQAPADALFAAPRAAYTQALLAANPAWRPSWRKSKT